MAKRLKRPKA